MRLDDFHPLPLLGNPHLQTLAGTFLLSVAPPSQTRRVDLPDGDQLTLEVSTPAGWTPTDPTAVLVHGLTGSHRSSYMVRMARKLHRRGVRAVRFNMRGCGSGAGLARRPYHAGCSDDLRAAIRALRALEPPSAGWWSLLGFSLGGNIVLKLAAELGDDPKPLVDEVIAVCPGADLHACYERLHGLPYERRFVRILRGEARARQRAFPHEPLPRIPGGRVSLFEFDDRYTAPVWSFLGAADYYARASAAPLVERIRLPCRVLLTEDDPIIDPAIFDRRPLPPSVELRKVPRGGHLGFLSRPGRDGVQWLDRQLLRWIGWSAPG